MKEFKSYLQQIELLKARGLIISDESFTLQKLIDENYYNVINGYKDFFIVVGTKDNFVSGTAFEEIYALYKFDSEIKDILLQRTLKVEKILRSLIAYHFSEKYGHDNYLKIDNFETLKNSNCTSKKYQERVVQIQSLLANIQQDISKNISKKEYINHYILNHGFVPLWVLVNVFTLGRLSQFYSLMDQAVRVKVAMHWNIKEEDLNQYIKTLANYRNLCAHDERLYNSRTNQDIPDTIYHQKLKLSLVKGRYVSGKNDVFSLIIILKILLPEEDFNTMCNKIDGRIKSLAQKLIHINYQCIIDSMGFPNDWIQIKKA